MDEEEAIGGVALTKHHLAGANGHGPELRVQDVERRRARAREKGKPGERRSGRGEIGYGDRHALVPGNDHGQRYPRSTAVDKRPQRMSSTAPESTSPRMPTISSNSAWPATSGGEIWITGSPRSSARQIIPASQSAVER